MKNVKSFLLAISISLVFSSCETKKEKASEIEKTAKILAYEIIDKEELETGNKAQLKIMSFLKDEFKSKEELENTIRDIYEKNKDEGNFKKFSEPTVVAIYLFTSREMAIQSPSSWIAMLMKTPPKDSEPRIDFDDYKIQSLIGLNDTVKTTEEIRNENLVKFLAKKNLNPCELYAWMQKMELESIHKADAKFPNYGLEHQEYADKLMENERTMLLKKHKLDDSIFTRVISYSMANCK